MVLPSWRRFKHSPTLLRMVRHFVVSPADRLVTIGLEKNLPIIADGVVLAFFVSTLGAHALPEDQQTVIRALRSLAVAPINWDKIVDAGALPPVVRSSRFQFVCLNTHTKGCLDCASKVRPSGSRCRGSGDN
jgi:hypothetical protein